MASEMKRIDGELVCAHCEHNPCECESVIIRRVRQEVEAAKRCFKLDKCTDDDE